MTVHSIDLHLAKIPLHTPYRVSEKIFHHFEPIVVEIRDMDGRTGFGEAIISKGYTHETLEEGWRFCRDIAPTLVGLDLQTAVSRIETGLRDFPTAATTLLSALDVMSNHELLSVAETTRVPLLDPVHSHDLAEIPDEIDALVERGFETLKVKVGFDVDEDLERVAAIQAAAAGRAEMRLDANRGFTREEGCRFAIGLEPASIQLFEQPCASDDWDANAAVAAVSPVPVMMDESIYGLDDIERAAGMEGVGFVKLKLKKLGNMDRLRNGLETIRRLGMTPVMGDGVATDICCWLEACVARVTLDNAGEMNGFLKLESCLLAEPLTFARGAIVLEPGYRPSLDQDALARTSVATEHYGAARVTAGRAS